MGGFYTACNSRKAPAYYTADSYYGAVLRDFIMKLKINGALSQSGEL